MTSGFIILDKPRDWTTFDLVRDLRKKSGVKKIGHTGTLDPFATGLVILCIGNATRLSSLLLSEDKGYVATIKLGTKTDTG
ncbi:MAG: tRNA pseudouridine(55) synthase, partial [Candidatus Cloacimonas sp.]|nr:tRNA pseudouridine(55) synthase TruB [Candidatus Cloacimonadota bacterium]